MPRATPDPRGGNRGTLGQKIQPGRILRTHFPSKIAGFIALASKKKAPGTQGILPGSANIDQIDPEADNFNIIRETVKSSPDYILSNSSGFGGANVSVVFKRIN